jgi:hypothetical protein
MPGISCHQKFHRLRLRVKPEGFLASALQQKLNSLSKVLQAFVLSLALSIGSWDFQTGCPKTAFVWLALMNDGRELFHIHNVNSFRSVFKPILKSWPRRTSRRFVTPYSSKTGKSLGRNGNPRNLTICAKNMDTAAVGVMPISRHLARLFRQLAGNPKLDLLSHVSNVPWC